MIHFWHLFGMENLKKQLLRTQKCISSNRIGLVKTRASMLTYRPKCITEKCIGSYTFVALFEKKGYKIRNKISHTPELSIFGIIS